VTGTAMVSPSRRNQRRHEAQQYRRLYKTLRWKIIRRIQLQEHPLCARCLARGEVTQATVVHHAEPHHGDEVRFFNGPFQSLCKRHHDSDAQSEERVGYSVEIGADGWPADARHPANS
jgi:5-methylcytosine-specific restriction enzyme A